MGRFEKILINSKGIDKRDSGYYSTPSFISEYLSSELLRLNPFGRKVLDPAVGDEELLKTFFLNGKLIDSFDIIEHGDIQYSNFKKQDFIEFYKEQKKSLFFENNIDLEYDYYIANPPYNCHEIDYIKDNKNELKSIFPKVGVHNMYSMFLSAIIDCAKEGALIGVIISDSFLTSTMHSGLRQQILDECSIHQLILCPNDLFWSQKADVRTCILILQKGAKFQDKIEIVNRPKNSNHLQNILEKREFITTDLDNIVLSKHKTANQFIIDIDTDILALFKNPRLGQLFDCITGISTGNDKKYLSKEQKKGYEVPFYKNPGSKKFKTNEDAYLINHFMEESLTVKDFMVRNKQFVFKEGITCSSMGLTFSACYLPPNSTFGVNPNVFTPKEDLFWVLAYLNSYLITYIVRGILIRSNMVTSGYISQLPIIPFTNDQKLILSNISKDVLDSKMNCDLAINKINTIVYSSLSLDKNIIEKIEDFALNLSKRV
ncbi:N-6 DNA methylase [Flavobacterium psychrophilum]|nr:N-6 DNA methylase [Flavobacterium psychrophilum]